ncbi:hypothetical protein NLX71_20410 [Paenibacillus sp. MZ04-78.2]|uniref:hypothetical protein n=1 Tax=Paenibacillus sp. MZ04-78.2 TaxID=2962034 RepID=UPI0020B7A2B9|nr:hypothetical protein [Paenibacillus sp. MZ04-78.2]MCP3775640.1 hypothetical protein [Paenibacillus sp. MZ04-78.2]
MRSKIWYGPARKDEREMIEYGNPDIRELRFARFHSRAEVRGEQWIDVEVSMELAEDSEAPEGIVELGALIVCTRRGDIVEIVPQDEGRDCEYQFTEQEKAQLRVYYEREVRLMVEHMR